MIEEPERLARRQAGAAYRAANPPRRMTEAETDEKTRAILSAACPPQLADPITGRIPPKRNTDADLPPLDEADGGRRGD